MPVFEVKVTSVKSDSRVDSELNLKLGMWNIREKKAYMKWKGEQPFWLSQVCMCGYTFPSLNHNDFHS